MIHNTTAFTGKSLKAVKELERERERRERETERGREGQEECREL